MEPYIAVCPVCGAENWRNRNQNSPNCFNCDHPLSVTMTGAQPVPGSSEKAATPVRNIFAGIFCFSSVLPYLIASYGYFAYKDAPGDRGLMVLVYVSLSIYIVGFNAVYGLIVMMIRLNSKSLKISVFISYLFGVILPFGLLAYKYIGGKH